MTMPMWDEAFLKTRARDEQDDAVAKLTDADWAAACRQFDRECSDTFRSYRECSLAACRRARRCVGEAMRCLEKPRPTVPPHVAQSLIEEIYAEMQEARREADEGADA